MFEKISFKLILLLFIGLFIVPGLVFLGNNDGPDLKDLSGLKLSQAPNVELISESGLTTRWDFVNESAGFYTFYYEPFDNVSSYWDLSGVSERVMVISKVFDEDSFVSSTAPNSNYGDLTFLISKYGSYLENSFLKWEYNYLDLNYTQDSTLRIYVSSIPGNDPEGQIYSCDDFSESTITWNNQPDIIALVGNYSNIPDIGIYNFDIDTPSYCYKINATDDFYNEMFFHSSENSQTSRRPKITHYLSKNYQGSGFLYCQTNETETLTLRSPNTLNLSLQEGDKIEIKFNTSSTNKIDVNLRNNSIQQKSYILSSQGNGDFSTRTKTFTVSSNMSVDQMEFVGSFIDTKNLIVDHVKVMRSYSETYSYYLAPYERREISLAYPYNYTVEIYERDILKETKYLETSTTLQTLIYERTDDNIVYINYFDTNNEYLDFNNYITYANYTLEGFTYTNKRLSSNILYVDKDTLIQFKIYDSFNALVKIYENYEETFIDITLDVYSLKIKNEYHKPVFYELKNNDTEIIKSGNIFSEEIIGYSIAIGTYIFNYTKDGEEESVNIDFSGHQILVINSSKICFLTYTNQKGQHLFFNNYKTYVDDSLIYNNIFYRDVGENISIEIKDLYDISVKNESYIVVSGDNYIPIILTEYSLKVMNQQEIFNHINITRDPNYYESPYYWSEWIAPNEIIKFNLFPGYYKINLTDNEGEAYSCYEYTLSGDDILLISSNNVISQVIYNIANVNTTLGNQITNVEINITNQNSQINNSIINIDINLGNINSTLGNMLVNLDLDITNIGNNITSLYTFTNNSFINLNNNMNTSFIYMENNIISINQSISNLVIGVQNEVMLINGSISTLIVDIGNDLLIMNTSIHTFLYALDVNLTTMGCNIDEYYILLNNSINLIDNNINDSRIAILNNLALINNTISNLISEIYSAVYLINNSIYTAVVDIGTYLSLMNNTISGNLSIVLQQNDFLTELYKMTMFSELLDWTDIGLDTSLLTSQIDAWEFINNYRDQAIQVFLKYQDKIENLTVSAQNTIEQYLPQDDVEYRLWSERDQKYLNKWTPLPDTKIVDFGFYEEEVPAEPDFEGTNTFIFLVFGVVIAMIIVISVIAVITRESRGKKKEYPKRKEYPKGKATSTRHRSKKK